MTKIFISYRRSDTDFVSGRLANDLARVFGENSVFRDMERIKLGVDYKKTLKTALDNCIALLAVIGPIWARSVDSNGQIRLNDPRDLVRLEIGTALRRNILVIPILIAETQMPSEEQLPAELKPLASRQAHHLNDLYWKQSLDALVDALREGGIGTASKIPTTIGKVKIRSNIRIIGNLFAPRVSIQVDEKRVAEMSLEDTLLIELTAGRTSISASVTSEASTLSSLWWSKNPIIQQKRTVIYVLPGQETILKLEFDRHGGGFYLVQVD
jgi:hypothetical protein